MNELEVIFLGIRNPKRIRDRINYYRDLLPQTRKKT
jgi:hypothetical protein